MKTCSICKTQKDLSDFNKNKSRKDGLQTHCKNCNREKSKKYYESNLEKHRLVTKIRTKKIKDNSQQKLLEYYSTHPCVRCGEANILVLEANHLKDKFMDISQMLVHKISWNKIEIELKKCEVLCSNCHKIFTHEQNNSYRWKYYKNLGC